MNILSLTTTLLSSVLVAASASMVIATTYPDTQNAKVVAIHKALRVALWVYWLSLTWSIITLWATI